MDTMDGKEAVAQFETAVREARVDRRKIKKIGQTLAIALQITGKSKKELSNLLNRATVDRWLAGTSLPHESQVIRVREYLMPASTIRHGAGLRSFALNLLDPRFRPVIKFLLIDEGIGSGLTEEQLADLLWMSEKSKGLLTNQMIFTFLGRT